MIVWFCNPFGISIHPPRVGRDAAKLEEKEIIRYFNPPSPCGEGPAQLGGEIMGVYAFQSTLPVWGGTHAGQRVASVSPEFQSTLPVWGGTNRDCHITITHIYFNPPSPCGEGQQKLTKILCKLLR